MVRGSNLAAAVLVLVLSPALAGEPADAELFGHRLTAERGERLRLASELDPQGWPELNALARKALRAGETNDFGAFVAMKALDEKIDALAERMRPRLRQAPLDALDQLARADLAMLRAAEPKAAAHCAYYLWPNPFDAPALRRAAKAAGREADLERLRAVKSAATLNADNPTYYAERASEEQAELRARGLSDAEIAFVAADARPKGVSEASGCRATIRYLEAVLDYPARLRSATLAWRMSGAYGDGDD